MFFRILLFLLIISASACAPKKEEIGMYDLKRVLERFAQNRIQTGIVSDSAKPAPSDQVLFEEACDVYRLSIPQAKEMLKKENKALFESIYGNE
ncbi:hypothetical protein P3G55_06055 [Leptospira sp. 96542]|nr:hypothetical protein [Leptospira sp. 96542]